MSLSEKTKEIMIVALANKAAGQELAEAVDATADEAADAAASADAAADSADEAEAAAAAIDAAATAVADLNQTISDPPTQAEVQAISDKVDELLAALRAIA